VSSSKPAKPTRKASWVWWKRLIAVGVGLGFLVAAEAFLRLVPLGFYYPHRLMLDNPDGLGPRLVQPMPYPTYSSLHTSREHLTIFQGDPDIIWSLRPGTLSGTQPDQVIPNRAVAINRLGLHNREITHEKPPDTFRILCMGDSITFGYGRFMRDVDAHPQRLEARLTLERPGVHYEVLNAGVPGYTSEQGRRWLTSLLELSPDVVVFAYCYNDKRETWVTDQEKMAYFESLAGQTLACCNRFELFRCLRFGLSGWRRGQDQRLEDLALPVRTEERPLRRRVSEERMRENLEAMIADSRRAGARVAIMFTDFMDLRRDPQLVEPAVLELATATGTPLFNAARHLQEQWQHPERLAEFPRSVAVLRERFGARLEREPSFWLMEEAIHPNALGHELLARGLYAFLDEHGLLSPPPRPQIYRGKRLPEPKPPAKRGE
jgi:lysophospholipase L1-like esterase